MNPLYWIAGIVALGLLLYLVFALVKPEWFG
ncbi:MAG TPA: K(+)-transporting ATPase subunit F [Anaerolineales bacterium]|nr:K(+)-transporting ATPase subunit F [Anaerolineales bacterium]HNB40267.1 K(+)-transporting ATPase subunit F [Anaerolineales bacterium]